MIGPASSPPCIGVRTAGHQRGGTYFYRSYSSVYRSIYLLTIVAVVAVVVLVLVVVVLVMVVVVVVVVVVIVVVVDFTAREGRINFKKTGGGRGGRAQRLPPQCVLCDLHPGVVFLHCLDRF